MKVVSSFELVPGDIVELEDHMLLPCDVVMLNGMSLVNESMLTGEAVSMMKSAIELPAGEILTSALPGAPTYSEHSSRKAPPASVGAFTYESSQQERAEMHELEIGADNRSTIYAATRIMQVKPSIRTPRAPVLACVVRTGFATVKGALILAIMW